MRLPVLHLLLFVGSLACQPGPEAEGQAAFQGAIDVDGREVFIRCFPGRGPTVLIDAGLGEGSDQWEAITEGLAEEFSVCAFDRPGYGSSDPGPLPRTPSANAATLKGLIASAELEGPFVLVGHSLGGLNALAFWTRHKTDVAGMVLIDPPPRAWLERRRFPGLWEMAISAGEQLQAASGRAQAAALPEASQLEAMASEHVGMMEMGASTSALDSFGDLPLLLIASARPNPAFGDSAAAYQQFWVEENRKVANRSTQGRIEVLSGVGHNMNQEVPEVLISLIRDFLTRF